MVLASQNVGYFGSYHLTTGFMVILFHKSPSLSRNSYEYDKWILTLCLYDTWILTNSSIEIIKWDTPYTISQNESEIHT
jgi:hypothetical protein